MQNNNLPTKALIAFSSTLKNVRSRKTVICFIFLGCLVLYLASTYLLPAHRHFHQYQIQNRVPVITSCLDKYLVKWNMLMEVNDAVVKKIPGSPTENRFFPFTGNGNIAFGIHEGIMQFYLLMDGKRLESYLPVLDIKIDGEHKQEEQAVVLSIKEGIVSVITSYIVNESCVLIEQIFYAHRKNMGLFHQIIEVENKGNFPITVSFTPLQLSEELHIKHIHTTIKDNSYQEYQNIAGEIEAKISDQKAIVSFNTVISPYQPKLSVRNKARNKVSLFSLTQFHHTVLPRNSNNKKKRPDVPIKTYNKDETTKMISELTAIVKDGNMFQQHTDIWNEIWKAGIAISSDNDPNSPSPLHVNLTEYYLYSTAQYNESDTKPLYCFNGPSTVHTAKFWVVPTNLDLLYNLKDIWYKYFQLNGCDSYNFTSMALSKLILLSMIGFQYRKPYLQMALNPLNLHSNISIRHMSLDYFQSPDSLDLQVVVTHQYVESIHIYVTCDGKHNPNIYGCASACESIVELGTSTLKFSVHTTDPVTPLLYLSTNRTHLEKIPHAPFMKVAVKTAQENHASPHHMKLSPKFWLAVVILIVSFHIVVLKMIYNECRKNRTSGRGRSPYNS